MEKKIKYNFNKKTNKHEFTCGNKKIEIDANNKCLDGQLLYNQFFKFYKNDDSYVVTSNKKLNENTEEYFIFDDFKKLIELIQTKINEKSKEKNLS